MGGIFILLIGVIRLYEQQEVTALKEQVKTLFTQVGEIKQDLKDLKNDLAKRLPLWATALISLLMMICGWAFGG